MIHEFLATAAVIALVGMYLLGRRHGRTEMTQVRLDLFKRAGVVYLRLSEGAKVIWSKHYRDLDDPDTKVPTPALYVHTELTKEPS